MSSAESLPLADIHLPPLVSLWPLAPAWWWLLVFLGLIIGGIILLIHYDKKHWRYRRQANTLMRNTYKQWKNHQLDNTATTNQLLNIIKRTAITAYPEQVSKSLFGKSWVNFLNQQTSTNYFNEPLSELLIHSQYQQSEPNKDQIILLYKAGCAWIKHHNKQLEVDETTGVITDV